MSRVGIVLQVYEETADIHTEHAARWIERDIGTPLRQALEDFRGDVALDGRLPQAHRVASGRSGSCACDTRHAGRAAIAAACSPGGCTWLRPCVAIAYAPAISQEHH